MIDAMPIRMRIRGQRFWKNLRTEKSRKSRFPNRNIIPTNINNAPQNSLLFIIIYSSINNGTLIKPELFRKANKR
jgi:hypothetical protein